MRCLGIPAISLLAFPVAAGAAGGEESAIVRTIGESAKAMSELPKSRDRQSVLRFYTADYRGVTDGQWQTRENLESVVGEIDENVKLGNPVRITNRATNIQAFVTGALGWATYDFYSKIEVLGEVLGEVERRCTGIYRKESAAWRIRHEHCSTSWAAPPEEEPEAPPPGQDRVPG
ncbi:MAG: nuclear transport factor 2 family protein [Candidatus Binatia bacterium]